VHRFLAMVLREALRDVGLLPSLAPLQPKRQALAAAWLTGQLDDQVVLPVATVCDGLGLDADALADAVRRRLPFVTTAACRHARRSVGSLYLRLTARSHRRLGLTTSNCIRETSVLAPGIELARVRRRRVRQWHRTSRSSIS
jgi:hypothetical protein